MFTGAGVAIVTPFKENGDIDFESKRVRAVKFASQSMWSFLIEYGLVAFAVDQIIDALIQRRSARFFLRIAQITTRCRLK